MGREDRSMTHFWACVILSHIAFLFINKFWGFFWIVLLIIGLIAQQIRNYVYSEKSE